MLRRSCMAGLLVVLAFLFTFAGCSDNSTGNNKIVGDPNAPEFQNMKAAIASSVDSTMSIMLRFAANPGRVAPQDTLTYASRLGRTQPDGYASSQLSSMAGTSSTWVSQPERITTALVDSVRFFWRTTLSTSTSAITSARWISSITRLTPTKGPRTTTRTPPRT